MLVSILDRKTVKVLHDYMALDVHHCWLFGSLCFHPPSLTCWKEKRKGGRRKEHPRRGWSAYWGAFSCWSAWETNGVGFTSHTSSISIRVNMHVRAFTCEGVLLLVCDCTRRGEMFQSRELERITGNVWEGREKSRRGCESKEKKKLYDWVKEFTRSVTVDQGSTGAGEVKQKGVIDKN